MVVFGSKKSWEGSLRGSNLLWRLVHFSRLRQGPQSIQGFSEISVLVLLIATFIAVGVMCARRVDSSLASMTSVAGAKAKHLRRQIVVTVAVVFVTFFLRAAYTTMLAIVIYKGKGGNFTCGERRLAL